MSWHHVVSDFTVSRSIERKVQSALEACLPTEHRHRENVVRAYFEPSMSLLKLEGDLRQVTEILSIQALRDFYPDGCVRMQRLLRELAEETAHEEKAQLASKAADALEHYKPEGTTQDGNLPASKFKHNQLNTEGRDPDNTLSKTMLGGGTTRDSSWVRRQWLIVRVVIATLMALTLKLGLDWSTSRSSFSVECPKHFQSLIVEEHGIGLCVPRSGWEIDRGPVDVDAADIFIRKSVDHDIGLHLHLSLLPPTFASKEKHPEYLRRLVNTYRQLDNELKYSEGVLSGYPTGSFQLKVKTSTTSIPKPTRYSIVFLTEEKILEAIRVWKHNPLDKRVLERMVSSLVFRAIR